MRFEFHDTEGNVRDLHANVEVDDMRCLLSEFKTHCAVEKSAYQFNHFVNWCRKRDIIIDHAENEIHRVDM